MNGNLLASIIFITAGILVIVFHERLGIYTARSQEKFIEKLLKLKISYGLENTKKVQLCWLFAGFFLIGFGLTIYFKR